MSKFKHADYVPAIRPPCAHAGCTNLAILSRRLPTGWAFLCQAHDLFHVQLEADEFCRRNGLTDREKQKQFIREKLKTIIAKRGTQALREPGQDDEEKAA